MVAGFLLMLVAAASKKEKWQTAYGIVGLVLIFWSLGFLGLGPVAQSLMPATALLFGLFSMYTKGSAQLICILVTIVLLLQVTNFV